jgi:hypothetical protein
LPVAALVSIGSLILYLPGYVALHGRNLLGMPLRELAAQHLLRPGRINSSVIIRWRHREASI